MTSNYIQFTVADRWGDAVDAGFTPVPNALFRSQAQLDLTTNEMVVLLNVLLHWWSPERLPSPRPATIAKRAGLGTRTVQRCISSLENKGMLERVKTDDGRSAYDPSGLRTKLSKLVKQDPLYRPEVMKGSISRIEASSSVQTSME